MLQFRSDQALIRWSARELEERISDLKKKMAAYRVSLLKHGDRHYESRNVD
jgi:ribosomal protein L29